MKKIFMLIVPIAILVIMISCKSPSQEESQSSLSVSLLPGIESFLSDHLEYGTVIRSKDMPNWSNGKRQQVITNKATYLFYVHNNEVVGVWRYTSNGEREQIFKKDIPETQKNVEKQAIDDLPAYTIIDQVNLITGGKFGDILITSFSRETPRITRESVLKRIAKKEGFKEATLYCTMEAYRANMSASYLKVHPNALKIGYLGSLKDGKFFDN